MRGGLAASAVVPGGVVRHEPRAFRHNELEDVPNLHVWMVVRPLAPARPHSGMNPVVTTAVKPKTKSTQSILKPMTT